MPTVLLFTRSVCSQQILCDQFDVLATLRHEHCRNSCSSGGVDSACSHLHEVHAVHLDLEQQAFALFSVTLVNDGKGQRSCLRSFFRAAES